MKNSSRIISSSSILRKLLQEYGLVITLILSCGLGISYNYYQNIDLPKQRSRIELHNEILTGTAPSPYQYRILVPFSTQVLKNAFSFLGPERSFLLAYFLYDFISISFSLFAIYIYLRTWFTKEQTLIGALLIAALMPVNFLYHYYQPWSLIEIGFFALGLYWIYRKQIIYLAILVGLAALNRETAVFIPVLYFLPLLTGLGKRRIRINSIRQELFQGIGLFLIWGVIFIGLRLIFGQAQHVVDPAELMARNLTRSNLLKTLLAVIVFWGLFWIFIFRGYLNAPDFLKATTWILPLYSITIIFWGVWYETRVWMSMYPIFIALGLCAAFPGQIRLSPTEDQGST